MNLTATTTPSKTMIASGRSTPRGIAIIHATTAPVAMTLRSEFRPPVVHIVGPASRISVQSGGEAPNGAAASYDLQFDDLDAVRDLIDSLETALREAATDPAQITLEAVR